MPSFRSPLRKPSLISTRNAGGIDLSIAPTVISSSAANSNTSIVTLTVPMPAGANIGDHLLAFLSKDDSGAEAVLPGFSKIGNGGKSTGSDKRDALFVRKVDGTEGSDFSFSTVGSISNSKGALILLVRDLNSAFALFDSGSNIDLPGIAANKPGLMLFAPHSGTTNLSVSSVTAGWTTVADNANQNNCFHIKGKSLAAGDVILEGSNVSVSWSSTATGAQVMLAILI